MKKILVVLALLSTVLFASSCNMFHGAGQDIEDAGDAVKDATN